VNLCTKVPATGSQNREISVKRLLRTQSLSRYVDAWKYWTDVHRAKCNKNLSCRKETVRLPRGSVLAKCNWEMTFLRTL